MCGIMKRSYEYFAILVSVRMLWGLMYFRYIFKMLLMPMAECFFSCLMTCGVSSIVLQSTEIHVCDCKSVCLLCVCGGG